MTLLRSMSIIAVLAWPCAAQDQRGDVIVRKDVQVMVGTPAFGPVTAPLEQGAPPVHTYQFIAAEMGFSNRVVKGKPYSAEAVTEINQVLADGNRISRKVSAMVYRDSEGRTRREQTLGMIGPFKPEGPPPTTISIEDPIAGVRYTLDPQRKVAFKLPMGKFEAMVAPPRQDGETGTTGGHVQVPDMGPDHAAAGVAMPPANVFYRAIHRTEPSNAEKLGQQIIEGVAAEGTRTITTIPAGELGNERPIETVSERWYAPQIEAIIMTRHNDPRQGETVYKLTNIQLTEPSRTLFEVPADYKVEEGPVFTAVPGLRRTK